MSTTTSEARVRRGPVELTARWFLHGQAYLARWFWGIAVVVAAVAIAWYALASDRVTTSVVQFGWQAVMWVPFSVFIGLVLVYLPVHVAAGLTRRTLSRGALVAAVGTALLYGGLFGALLLVERWLYSVFGWHWGLTGWATTGAGMTAAYIVAHAATLVLAYVSGLLVALVYLRGGGWWGTLTLPLTVGPLVGLSSVLGWDIGPFSGTPALVADSVLALLAAAVMAVVVDVLVRGAAVPARR